MSCTTNSTGHTFATDALEKRVAKLMLDEDVERKSGTYPYVPDGDERHLNIRAFRKYERRGIREVRRNLPKMQHTL